MFLWIPQFVCVLYLCLFVTQNSLAGYQTSHNSLARSYYIWLTTPKMTIDNFAFETTFFQISGSQPFLFLGHLFFLEGMGPQGKFFYMPLPPLFSPPLFSPPLSFQKLGGLGECCRLPQWGLGQNPSWQCILEHSRAESDRFWHVARYFPAFKATRNFSICTKN